MTQLRATATCCAVPANVRAPLFTSIYIRILSLDQDRRPLSDTEGFEQGTGVRAARDLDGFPTG